MAEFSCVGRTSRGPTGRQALSFCFNINSSNTICRSGPCGRNHKKTKVLDGRTFIPLKTSMEPENTQPSIFGFHVGFEGCMFLCLFAIFDLKRALVIYYDWVLEFFRAIFALCVSICLTWRCPNCRQDPNCFVGVWTSHCQCQWLVPVRAVLGIHISAVDPAYASFEVNVTMVRIVAFAMCTMHFGRTRDGVEGFHFWCLTSVILCPWFGTPLLAMVGKWQKGQMTTPTTNSPNSVFNTWGSYGNSKRPGG